MCRIGWLRRCLRIKCRLVVQRIKKQICLFFFFFSSPCSVKKLSWPARMISLCPGYSSSQIALHCLGADKRSPEDLSKLWTSLIHCALCVWYPTVQHSNRHFINNVALNKSSQFFVCFFVSFEIYYYWDNCESIFLKKMSLEYLEPHIKVNYFLEMPFITSLCPLMNKFRVILKPC